MINYRDCSNLIRTWSPLPLAKWYKPAVDAVREEQRKLDFEASIPVLDARLAAQPIEKMVFYCGVPVDRFSAPALVRIVVSVMEELERERKMHGQSVDLMKTLATARFT